MEVLQVNKPMLPMCRFVFLAVASLSHVTAGVISGTVTLDGNVIHYQAFNGTDPAAFAQFLAGAQLIDFESVSGVTPLAVTSYTGSPTAPANLIEPTIGINGAFFSAGGQTPGKPENGGAPAVLLDVSSLSGAHSGNNVLGPTTQGDPTNPLDFTGFFSVNFPVAQPISRFGWWTNPDGGAVAFPPHINTLDSSGTLVDLSSGILFTANPGDFVAFAFDQSVVNEVELFQGAPTTMDDFTYARDNALPFGTSTSVPEPASWFLVLCGSAFAGVAAAQKRRMRR
jgi:hypothetical protein